MHTGTAKESAGDSISASKLGQAACPFSADGASWAPRGQSQRAVMKPTAPDCPADGPTMMRRPLCGCGVKAVCIKPLTASCRRAGPARSNVPPHRGIRPTAEEPEVTTQTIPSASATKTGLHGAAIRSFDLAAVLTSVVKVNRAYRRSSFQSAATQPHRHRSRPAGSASTAPLPREVVRRLQTARRSGPRNHDPRSHQLKCQRSRQRLAGDAEPVNGTVETAQLQAVGRMCIPVPLHQSRRAIIHTATHRFSSAAYASLITALHCYRRP